MGFAEGVGVGFDGELRLAAMFRASWHAGSPFASCFIAAGKVESELVFFKPCCNKTNTWHLEFLYFSELTLKKKKRHSQSDFYYQQTLLSGVQGCMCFWLLLE